MAHVFVSYSRRDSDTADQLVRNLEAAGYKVWIDREGILGGDEWRSQIVNAIDDCTAFMILLTPNSVASRNVRKELDLAENRGKPIIPIVLRRVTVPPEMEYQLVGLQMIDLTFNPDVGFTRLLRALDRRQTVVLTQVGPKKIEVIKTVRRLTSLGLRESKELVDRAPAVVLENVPESVAADAKRQLEAIGASVEVGAGRGVSIYTVILTQIGNKKIEVIKTVRSLTGLGLREAKELVDGTPAVVLANVPDSVAWDASRKLEAAGASAQVKASYAD